MSEQYRAELITAIQAFIDNTPVLLPSSAVAEVVDYAKPNLASGENSPNWYLGDIDWRGLQVPLIALQALNHGAEDAKVIGGQAKIVVVHYSQSSPSKPYWAFISASTPRIYRLEPDEIQASELAVEENHAAAMWALLNDEQNLLLDLAFIEQQINQL